MKNQTKRNKLKRSMLESLEQSRGVVATAARNVGISRHTHYKWYRKYQAYRDAVDDIVEISLDIPFIRIIFESPEQLHQAEPVIKTSLEAFEGLEMKVSAGK